MQNIIRFIFLIFLCCFSQKILAQNISLAYILEASQFCGFSKDSLTNHFNSYDFVDDESLGCGNEVLTFYDKLSYKRINNLEFVIERKKCIAVGFYYEFSEKTLIDILQLLNENFTKISEREWHFLYKEQKKRIIISKYPHGIDLGISNVNSK
jgi:hypothetical protein